jgi:hypothetical protein
MTGKAFLAATLVLPFIALSGAAYAGPTSSYPPANTGWKGNGAYAMYMPTTHADGSTCLYQGGPKSAVWHQHRH